jgi:hypothetical protein
MLGIRLEAEYHAWQRHAPGSSLSDAVHALAEQDAGDDVVWVVGLTSALGASPTDVNFRADRAADSPAIVRNSGTPRPEEAPDRNLSDGAPAHP